MFMGATLILGACGADEEAATTNSSNNTGSNTGEKQEEVKKDKPKDDGDSVLTEIGEVEENDGNKAKLLGLWDEGKVVHDGDFKVTLNSVKLIELQEINPQTKDTIMMNAMINELETPAYYLQVDYKVANNTGEAVWWNDIETALYGKQQLEGMSDFIITQSEPMDNILDGTEYEGQAGLLVNNPDADNVKLKFSQVYTEEGMNSVVEPKEIDLTLKK